jgi:hypothetical protein
MHIGSQHRHSLTECELAQVKSFINLNIPGLYFWVQCRMNVRLEIKMEKTDLESIDGVAILDKFVAPLIGICNHRCGLLSCASYESVLPRNGRVRQNLISRRIVPNIGAVERLEQY